MRILSEAGGSCHPPSPSGHHATAAVGSDPAVASSTAPACPPHRGGAGAACRAAAIARLATPAFTSAGAGASGRLPHQRRFPDLADLVAHPRRILELQVAGVLVHLLLQRLEPGREPGGVKRGVILGL